MIHLEEIQFDELKLLVEFGFRNDEALMSTYQQMQTDFDVTVQRNLTNIYESKDLFDLKFYRVIWNNQPIGFSVLSFKESLLYSFALGISFRTKEIVVEWINKIKEMFSGFIGCLLWNQNLRAINFLVKNGFKIVEVGNEVSTLIFEKS